MTKTKLVLGLFLLLIFALTVNPAMAGRQIDKIKFPPLNDLTMPDIEVKKLDNGITLYLLENNELPIVEASVNLAAGSFLDPADKIGLGDITGSVMRTGGTAKMTGDEIDEILEALGATVETYIDRVDGGAYMNILSDEVNTGLVILADILRTPQFAEDKIDIEKSSHRTAISSRNDEPFDICIREYRKILYGADSPYARHTEYATIDKITRDDLIAFHKQFITPENIMIAVYGDFKSSEMLATIEKLFGDWEPSGQKVPPLPEVKVEFKKGIHYIEKDQVTQSSVLLGHIGGLTGDPDYFALTVANNVLGGGLGGRMFNEVRSKKGLAYSTGGAYTSNIAYPGIFYGYVITKLETTVAAAEAVWQEMRRMQTDPPTPEELKKAKDAYLNSFVFGFDSKSEIINRMMNYDFYGFPRDFLQTAKTKIEQITAEDVLDVCQRRFHPEEMHLVVVGSADKFDKELSTLGEVENIDITIPSGESDDDIVINEETLAQGMALLNKAAEASGGVKNFAKIKNGKTISTTTIFTPQMNLELAGESLFEFPYNSKDVMSNAMIGEMISVTTETAGWAKQMGQITEMSAEDLVDSRKDNFRNLIVLYSKLDNPDYQAVYAGPMEINGKATEVIKVIANESDATFKLAIDSETFMPVAKMYFGNTFMGPANLTQYLSDFRKVDGIMVSFAGEVMADGNKMVEVSVTEKSFNIDIPAGTFVKPE